MENGLPQNKRRSWLWHKSIAMIAKKHNGYCAFEATDEIFILRVVLPL